MFEVDRQKVISERPPHSNEPTTQRPVSELVVGEIAHPDMKICNICGLVILGRSELIKVSSIPACCHISDLSDMKRSTFDMHMPDIRDKRERSGPRSLFTTTSNANFAMPLPQTRNTSSVTSL